MLNTQQQAALDSCLAPGPSLNVIARAGCGKSTLLLAIAAAVPGRAFLGSFNRAIADELKSRLPQRPGLNVNTLHGAGLGAWRKHTSRVEVDGRKIQTIARKTWAMDNKVAQAADLLIGYAKLSGFGLNSPYEDVDAWEQLIDYYDIEEEIPSTIKRKLFLEGCVWTYEQSLEWCLGRGAPNGVSTLDFNDMLLAPLYFRIRLPQYDWFLMDEAQDTGYTRQELAVGMIGGGRTGRMVAAGDPCQPAGTKIRIVVNRSPFGKDGAITTQVPIEKLKVGDRLVSYCAGDCAFIMGRELLGITRRRYTGRLIRMTLDSGQTSRYTPNHHCLVSFSALRGHYAIYLMRRNDKFRIGRCRMDYSQAAYNISNGVSSRMRAEHADAMWLLTTCETLAQAYEVENTLGANFGLPQIMFTAKNNSIVTQESLDRIWAEIDAKRNVDAAQRVLEHFGRDIKYPLMTSAQTYRTLKRPVVTRACNVLDGCTVLPYKWQDVHTRMADWRPVTLINEDYDGWVYSLDVEKDHLYVGDGIITHNCQAIYHFAGSSSDGMAAIKNRLGSIELPLNVTYRCPRSVVTLAQQWVPDFTAHPSATDGIIRTLHHADFWAEKFDPYKDVILCRYTRPLAGIAVNLRDKGIPCVVEGQSSKGLLALVNKWGNDLSIDMYLDLLEGWENQVTDDWAAKERPDKAAAFRDRCGTVRAFAKRLGPKQTTKELARQIEMTFREQDRAGALTLCTVHRSKGREWERVYLIGRNAYMPSSWASTAEERQGEENLQYVAVTRTKRELVEVIVPETEPGRRADRDWWDLMGE